MKKNLIICGFALLAASCTNPLTNTGNTLITKWQDGKKGAVSLTYDDGSINQFRKALPLMNELAMPGTFFINTGSFPGSTYRGTFIGRDVKEIIKETATIPTGEENYFETEHARAYECFCHFGAKRQAYPGGSHPPPGHPAV